LGGCLGRPIGYANQEDDQDVVETAARQHETLELHGSFLCFSLSVFCYDFLFSLNDGQDFFT